MCFIHRILFRNVDLFSVQCVTVSSSTEYRVFIAGFIRQVYVI